MKRLEDRLRMLAEAPGIDLRETLKVLLDTSIAMTDLATRALSDGPMVSREEYLVGLIKEMLPDVQQQRERNWRSGAPITSLSDYDRLIRAAQAEIEFQAKKSPHRGEKHLKP